ncbi:MAG TPA: MFS transporter [Bryobacteraceae bacterium]|jgi:predicted MFS family arabinose efflux permease
MPSLPAQAVDTGAELRVPVGLLAFSVGAIVANIYYAQPLLAEMARTFDVSVTRIGFVAMLSQIGTATGMFFFVPLGDNHERRSLISWLLVAASISLASMAAAPNILFLELSAFAVGATASTVHVVVPLAAQLAPEARRGRVVGTVLGGLLLGILLARTFSGFAASLFGWRSVYSIASAGMLVVALLLRVRLPQCPPLHRLSWVQLIQSIGSLIRKHGTLREAALLGATLFCAFSAFWTTLVFLLQTPPYHYGPSVAGMFGLVGAAGALCAPFAGHLIDRQGPRSTILAALVTTLASFVLLAAAGKIMVGLIVGVVLLDLGVQAGHVANQTRIYSIDPAARSRLNTVYMFLYFVGGALGSYFGAICWVHWGWVGVCGLAMAVLTASLGTYLAVGFR